MRKNDPIIAIYNKHIAFTFAVIIAISVIIGSMTVVPFYSNLKKFSDDEFNRFAHTVNNNIQHHITEITNIALQVTSRTKARNTLVAYNNGELDKNKAGEIIGDILQDALRSSKIASGVVRLSKKGEPVAMAGDDVPEHYIRNGRFADDKPLVYVCNHMGDVPFFIIDAPIKDRAGKVVGNDVLVFRTFRLERILKKSEGLFKGSSINLKYNYNNDTDSLYSSDSMDMGAADAVVRKLDIKEAKLQLFVSVSKDVLYAVPHAELKRIISLLGLLLILGCAGVFVLQSIFRRSIKNEICLRETREQELRDSNTRFETVMDSLDALVYVADIKTHELIFLNKYGRETWGDPEGKTCYKFLQSGMDEPCSFCTNSKLVDESGEPSGIHVWELQNTANGSWYQCRDQAIRWMDGRLVRLEIATDITELKEMEQQLSDLTHNLIDRVNQEIAKRSKNEQLLIQQSKMAAMGEMIGVIAHQLKQPLNNISIISQEITEICRDLDIDTSEFEFLEKHILEQVVHMDETIQNFRNFFVPSDEKAVFQICSVVEDVFNLIEGRFKALDIKYSIDDHECVSIFGLPNEFKQVMLNIYGNACDVLEKREDCERVITLSVFKEGAMAVVKINDNGGGIPEEMLPDKLFNPYVSSKGEQGTGIGLQISKIIIEDKFSGKISAHNTEEGAEFILEIPAFEEKP